jgi:hypothetical protein
MAYVSVRAGYGQTPGDMGLLVNAEVVANPSCRTLQSQLVELFNSFICQQSISQLSALSVSNMTMTKLELPSSYATYPWKHILVSHLPLSSPVATKVVVITMNRPEQGNAFTAEIETEMIRAMDLINDDDRVRIAVVTGRGKMFCVGADLDIGLHREEGGTPKGHRDGFVSSTAHPTILLQGEE